MDVLVLGDVTHVCFEVCEFGNLRGEPTMIAICLQGE